MQRTTSLLLLLGWIAISCTNSENEANRLATIEKLQIENDSLINTINQNLNNTMDQQIITFLTFQKADAEQAMNFYVELFDNSEIVSLKRWGKEGASKEGTIMHATFSLNGKMFMCSDSPAIHEWGFTPAVSNWVNCSDEAELNHLFQQLSDNGKVLMPIDNYGFSEKFAFVEDKFGVSWQLNLQ